MIVPQVHAGSVDIGALAAPRAYAQPSWGFSSAYRGSEAVLQIVGTHEFAPGEQFDAAPVREGLGDIFSLAGLSALGTDVLDDYAHLCICRSASSADGAWLARLFAQPGISDDRQTRAWTRRQTLRILARCTELTSIQHVSEDISRFLAYDEAVTEDRVLAGIVVSARWRGLILRNHSVGAWRDLWAWMVNEASTGSPRARAGRPVRRCAATTVGGGVQRWSSRHSTASGQPAPAELDPGLAESDWPVWSLSVLLIGARRSRELAGHELSGFQGNDPEDIFEELSPPGWPARPICGMAGRCGTSRGGWLTSW